MACAQNKRIGTIPKFFVLGAMLQIQGYTLHLVTLVLTPFKIKYLQSLKLPSGGLDLTREGLPLFTVPSQQVTIARSPVFSNSPRIHMNGHE